MGIKVSDREDEKRKGKKKKEKITRQKPEKSIELPDTSESKSKAPSSGRNEDVENIPVRKRAKIAYVNEDTKRKKKDKRKKGHYVDVPLELNAVKEKIPEFSNTTNDTDSQNSNQKLQYIPTNEIQKPLPTKSPDVINTSDTPVVQKEESKDAIGDENKNITPSEPMRRRAKIVKVDNEKKKRQGKSRFSKKKKDSKFSDSSEGIDARYEMEVLKSIKKKKKSNLAEEARKRIEIAREITLPKNIESIEKYNIIPGMVNVEIIWNKDMLESIYVVTEPELEFEESQFLARIEADMEQVIRSLKTLPDDLSQISIEKIASNYLTGRKSVYSLKAIENLKYYIKRDYEGYGPLDAIIRDPMVEDISCNGVGVPIFIEHKIHGSLKTNIVFETDEQLDSYVVRLAQLCGKEVSMNEPIVDGTFPHGHRIQMTYGKEISSKGSSFTFRLFRETPFTPIELVKYGAATAEVVTYLWFAVENLKSSIIAGVPGVGKTSTINAMLMFAPPNTKIFSIEETREINIFHQNWVATSTRESIYSSGTDSKNPPIGMFELVRMAMRQRPTYIVLGEIRGRESYSLFQAISTGHTAYSTIHADSMETLINRLESNPLNIPRVLISSLDFVLFNKFIRIGSRSMRKITEIDEIMGIDTESGEILYNRVFNFDYGENRQVYSQYSKLLKEVKESKQMSDADFQKEFDQRKKLIENMVENNINDYERITKVINIFYKDKESAFKLSGGQL